MRLSVAAACTVAMALLGLPAPSEAGPACSDTGAGVLVRVHGVQSDKGSLVGVLYGDDPAEFLQRGKRLARERVPARPGSVDLCLAAPRPGTYAVVVYHDENDNHRFDRGWTGLPSEGYGISNNPRPWLRMPTHTEAAFKIGTPRQTLDITLSYP